MKRMGREKQGGLWRRRKKKDERCRVKRKSKKG